MALVNAKAQNLQVLNKKLLFSEYYMQKISFLQ